MREEPRTEPRTMPKVIRAGAGARQNSAAQSTRGPGQVRHRVRAHALECLSSNPKHAGCLHVMGMWNAEVMRLNGIARLVAKNFLGGKVFGTANWKEAVRYMEASVAAIPSGSCTTSIWARSTGRRGQGQGAGGVRDGDPPSRDGCQRSCLQGAGSVGPVD